MDKKSLIGLGLIALILIVGLAISGPSKEQIARNKFIKDSIEQVNVQLQLAEQTKQAELQKTNAQLTSAIPDSIKQIQNASIYKDLAVSVNGTSEVFKLENENLIVYINSKGAKVEKVELKKYNRYNKTEPLILFDKDSTVQNIQFEAFATKTKFSTDSFYFKSTGIVGNTIHLKLETSSPQNYIEYVYTLKPNDYMLDFDLNIVGMQNIISAGASQLTFNWKQAMPSQEQHITKEREAATVYFKDTEDGVDYINARKSEEKIFEEGNIKWMSFKQHFFNSTLIANTEFLKAGSSVVTYEDPKSTDIVKSISAKLAVPYKHLPNENFGMKFYFGPTHYNTLKKYDDLDLQQIIPTGWSVFSYINKWLVIPVMSNLSGMNMGIVILILTLIIKTLLFPTAYKAYMSGAKMRALKPELDELNAKFEKNEDPMKKQQEQMALYKRAGANPLSGCLPMLLQMPILMALFNFFPASIELRQNAFLWCPDLSTYDSVYNFGFEVWGFGDHISLFAMLMFASTIIYTWMNSAMMMQPQQNQQMPGMKYMMYLMPVIFLAVMNSYAAGLSWYYFLANVITFLQTWIMKLVIDDGKIRDTLLANMKKPEKKSTFQAKLEEMAKRQQTLTAKK